MAFCSLCTAGYAVASKNSPSELQALIHMVIFEIIVRHVAKPRGLRGRRVAACAQCGDQALPPVLTLHSFCNPPLCTARLDILPQLETLLPSCQCGRCKLRLGL